MPCCRRRISTCGAISRSRPACCSRSSCSFPKPPGSADREDPAMEDFVSAPWLRRLITVAVLAGLVLLGFRVLEPFIVPLVWAGILAYVSWPAYEWLLRACRGRSVT